MADTIILFAHGSRDPEWAAPLRELQKSVASQRPDAQVLLSFLELMQPDLPAALAQAAAQGARRATVVPLFLSAGAHLKSDLPRLVEAASVAHPQLAVRVLPPLGENEAVLRVLADWIAQAAKDGV
jgi:sirohydrochlorin cobaltochelatase